MEKLATTLVVGSAPNRGRLVRKTHYVAIKDSYTPVPVVVTLEVPDGFEIESVGMERGDPTWNDGQGYVNLRLSVLKDETSGT